MALSPEDLQQIKDLMTSTIQAMQQTQAPTLADSPQTPEPTLADSPQTPEQTQPVTPAIPGADAFKQMMEEVLDSKLKREESNVATTIWNERLDTLRETNPALGEYLDGNDEFGQPRMERINAGGFAERTKTLSTLMQNFNAAQVASTGGSQQPVIPKKIKEQADKTNQQYAELDTKLAEGDMSPSDHTNAFFNNLETEVLDQMSTH